MGRERPSYHGAVLGEYLAQMAESATGFLPEDCCATCAFRRGCMTNQMASTGLVAFKCAMGVDPDAFACHHGMKDGEPTKICAGWLAAQAAEWDDIKNFSEQLTASLGAIPNPDPIRTAFDAWIERVDPAGTLNDYQRGRLYLRHYGTSAYPGDGEGQGTERPQVEGDRSRNAAPSEGEG
jgi:hypothetical protein